MIMQYEKVGITGTRAGMTDQQRKGLYDLLSEWKPKWMHQGDCIGVDAQAVEMARALDIMIVSHPPFDPKYRAFAYFDVEKKPMAYLLRNEMIVNASQVLIGMPRLTREQLRSGTWACIRYARVVQKPHYIIYPNGRLEGVTYAR